ncbi:beta-lactamase family protein [Mucilaginibacter achroorhodeus]|uniref:Beta-lactamase family protein n=1 Tax=Mucilaginibacter achroorhodeus TaxID=2599294 RepID=A0A563U9M0_9SPHI|nr:serine hydrolase domain-containing protein [Mucilaginibacter achroorhodeus]TWR28045.1 beta-lactamase family protein [Mucilaginibacter achroorhodeus]
MKNTCLTLLLAAASLVATAQNKTATIDSLIRRSNRIGVFKGNVLVMDKDKVVYKAAIGYTDATEKQAVTNAYRFHIGSIAKEFNAMAIMMLKEQGKLNTDDKVSKYITGLPAWADKISIKNLLQYTSGLPNLKWGELTSDAEAMAALNAFNKLDFEPGTRYAYNNSNTLLQRQIIAKITGRSFADFVKEKMLKPCGMTNSIVDPTDEPLVAKSYNNDKVQSPMQYPITGWTAVTLDDFYKWEKALESFKLIGPQSTREILTPFAPGKQCGLGGGVMDGDKLTYHQHDGTALNYQALLTAYPAQGRTIILLTNNKQNTLYDVDHAIEAILDGKPYQQPKRSVLNDFAKQLDSLKGNEIIPWYNNLKSKYAAEYGFENESSLNMIGYYYKGKTALMMPLRCLIIILSYSRNQAMFLTAWAMPTMPKVIKRKPCLTINAPLL